MSATMCGNCEYLDCTDSKVYPDYFKGGEITVYKCTWLMRNAVPMWVMGIVEDNRFAPSYVSDQDGVDCLAWDFIQDPDRNIE